MPYASLGGRRFYYEVGGEGETVLFLHGSFADADLLEAPATAVSSGFRALRFDRRGHGRSSDAPEPLSLADEAAEMAALLDWFSTEKTHLFAHDDGAEVAVQFALDFPARTLSLALLAPTLEGFPWKDQTLAARRDLLSVFARWKGPSSAFRPSTAGHASRAGRSRGPRIPGRRRPRGSARSARARSSSWATARTPSGCAARPRSSRAFAGRKGRRSPARPAFCTSRTRTTSCGG